MSIVLIGGACGKVGSPVPPSRLSERTAELTAVQRGASILLSWPLPVLVQDESSRSFISRVDIYRLAERRDQEAVLDPDDYERTAQIVGVLDRAKIEAQAKSSASLHYTDGVSLTDSNTRLRYAVRYVNKRDQAAAFSNTVAIEPASAVALPPADLIAKAEVQDAVTISWSPPAANIDGASPASVLGYNIYRRMAKREFAGELLNSEPVTGTSFTDTRFQYMVEYVYYVRALSQGASGLVESADSEPLSFKPVDKFAPSAPKPVSAASANGTISLFWPSSAEQDVIGYNVYRSSSADTPDEQWIKLNDQPLTTVTFRDDLVVIDQMYLYRVTAIDRFNNESERSRVVSEIAHP
ncbi:MAG TPA: fibronectin type III domain-containing protein [Blastocatellia bacterium]|nr:fibronectin type III domain-containing protein [Blastocatellia bacterium]